MHSKPTVVTANAGIDIAGELLFFLFLSAGQQRSRPTRAQTSRSSYFFFVFVSGPAAVTADKGTDIAGKLLIFS